MFSMLYPHIGNITYCPF
nr:unnamed protein product [Callosobruchus analis]